MSGLRHVFMVVLMALLGTGCAGHLVYSSGPYRGQVLDAETKEPLVGAVVLAIWYREVAFIPMAAHSPAVDYHDALEVLTDAQGEFTVPAKTHLTVIGKIREPEFVIYYPGYAPYPSVQAYPQRKEEITAAYREKYFRVQLSKLRTREEQLRNLDVRPARVPIEKMPNLTRLLNVEAINLDLSPLPVPGERRK